MSAARMPDFRVNDLDERMGSPTELAIFAAEQYRARSFFGRHPIFTFLFGPLPLLLTLWIAFWAVLAIPCLGIEYFSEHVFGRPIIEENYPMLGHVLLSFFVWELIVLAPLITAWHLCRVAHRNALGWRWPVAACSLLAFFVSLLQFTWQLKGTPNVPGQMGYFMIGIGPGSSLSWALLTWLPKFALALGIGLALVWREQRRDRGEISDSSATISTLPAA